MEELIRRRIAAHQEAVERVRATLLEPISDSARVLCDCLRRGGKILICGNGGSAADAQHFSTELAVQFRSRRRALPAIALTTDTSILTAAANDFGFGAVFERQVEAIGRPVDALVGISTSGNSENVLRACGAALGMGMEVIGLTGEAGGRLAELLKPGRLLRVPCKLTDIVQEMHILILHLWCELIEEELALGPVC